MHELAVCQALLSEVQRAAGAAPGQPLRRVVVRIGPLAGVEPHLLQHAFTVARAGGIAADAELAVEFTGVRVACLDCRAESEVPPNRLLCAQCGGWRTRVIAGDELVLQRLEFAAAPLAA